MALRALAPKIADLAARDRDTLLLYAWGDLTYEQIAVAQGIPVGNGAVPAQPGAPQARSPRGPTPLGSTMD